MSRKPVPAVPRVPLPHDWRNQVPTWRIIAMLAKVPQDQYLDEVRAFENDVISNRTLSDDWEAAWKAHCHRRMVAAAPVAAPLTSLGLFD